MLESNQVYAALGQEPLFKYAIRRIRWGETVRQLRRYNLRAVLIVHALVVGLWLLGLITSGGYPPTYGYYTPGYYIYIQGVNTANWLLLGTIGLDIILDFACLVFAINSIGGEISAGRWDLLRMTPLPEERIVEAKHGIAQVRAWRVMAVVLFARVATVMLILFNTFVLPPVLGVSGPLADIFRYEFFNPLLVLITAVIFLAVYVIEPVWRMRALTAVGVAISARVHSLVFALLAAFAAIVAIWINQALIIGIIGWITIRIATIIPDASIYMCAVLPACIGTAFIVRSYYTSLAGWALGYATRRVYQEEG